MADIGKRSDWNESDWLEEDVYWENSYRTRPYAAAAGSYGDYQPGYRYGYESAQRYSGRDWDEVEPELSRNWSSYEHRGTSTWEQIKGAVRDAWDRMTNRRSTVTK